jgi:hypothetical protein
MTAYRKPGPNGIVDQSDRLLNELVDELSNTHLPPPQNAFVPGPLRIDDMRLKPYIKSLLTPKPSRTMKVLKFLTKWGRNASPFTIAYNLVFQLHWKGFSFWMDVRKAARKGRALLKYVDGLEKGAIAFSKATREQAAAESKLPAYPIKSNENSGPIMVSAAELAYVEKYYNSAAMIANDAMAARSHLIKAIAGWDAVIVEANKTKDFTRKAVWDAITTLDFRFHKKGGGFRAYLIKARDRANRVEDEARDKQYHAADILGKWTPQGYQPPAGPL